MDVRVEIVAEEVTCRQDGQVAFSAPLKDFLEAVVARSEHQTFPEAIPEGVRFIRRRGDVTVLVLEERPALRTVAGSRMIRPRPMARKQFIEPRGSPSPLWFSSSPFGPGR